jgi:hypothetical protein
VFGLTGPIGTIQRRLEEPVSKIIYTKFWP